jgi:hypothetical protein
VYKQVVLEKNIGRWKQRRTEWVPELLAVKGKKLRAHLQREFWENSWEVVEVMVFNEAPPPFYELRLWEEMPT